MVSKAESHNKIVVIGFSERIAKNFHKAWKRKAYDLVGRTNVVKDHYTDSIKVKYDGGQWVVGSTSPHARAVENGRQAGYHVPIQPLIKWLMAEKRMPWIEARSAAFALEKKIYADGIRGKHVLEITMQDFVSELA